MSYPPRNHVWDGARWVPPPALRELHDSGLVTIAPGGIEHFSWTPEEPVQTSFIGVFGPHNRKTGWVYDTVHYRAQFTDLVVVQLALEADSFLDMSHLAAEHLCEEAVWAWYREGITTHKCAVAPGLKLAVAVQNRGQQARQVGMRVWGQRQAA